MATSTVQYPSVSILNSQLRQITSFIIGQEYQIKIRLPENYENTSTRYPVLYLLDGDHAFGMATDIVQYLIYGGHIPDIIIASPAYGSKLAPYEGGKNMRDGDLNPFPEPLDNVTPRGIEYLEFLERELIPFVESNYRVAPNDRTLWGYSYGCYFALYVMFHKPSLFQRYIMVDGFDSRYFTIEETYASQHTDLPIQLCFFTPPGDKGRDETKFFNTLKGRNYTNFKSEYMELNDIGHFAVPAEGLTKGLVSVFRE